MEREVLVLASYCGDDNPECSDRRPCVACLGMSNVFKITCTDAEMKYQRELAPDWNTDELPHLKGVHGILLGLKRRINEGRDVDFATATLTRIEWLCAEIKRLSHVSSSRADASKGISKAELRECEMEAMHVENVRRAKSPNLTQS